MAKKEKRPLSRRRVRDCMTRDPLTVEPSDTLLDAAIALRSHGFRHLPVVDGVRLVGMLSEGDVARLSPTMLLPHTAEEHHRVLREAKVGTVMTRELVSLEAGAPLDEAVVLLERHALGALPVLEEGRLVGIITTRDVLCALHECLTAGPQAA